MVFPNQRHQPIDAQLFVKHRARLAAQLPPGTLVILHANDVMPTSADGLMPFWQSTDLFYLSGIVQEETILMLYKADEGQSLQSFLFLKKTSPEIARWEGHKYTMEQAHAASGITQLHWLEAFPKLWHQLMGRAEYVFLNTNEHSRAVVEVTTRDARFVQQCQQRYPLHRYRRLAPLMHLLRAVKDEQEIALLRKACQITAKGFAALLRQLRPGVMEYALEAELIHTYTRHGAEGFAYTPIVASGANSCVLHYVANSRPCAAGGVVLVDAGARYGGYCADMTRTVPVDGRFTPRQRAVYEAVLRVMQYAKSLLLPGTTHLAAYQQQVGLRMQQELLELGLITSKQVRDQDPKHPAYKRYFMHGTSHYLGLDTHDVGDFERLLEPGMVVTVEPGIYINEEGLGIRLENDAVIREGGVEDLMDGEELDQPDTFN